MTKKEDAAKAKADKKAEKEANKDKKFGKKLALAEAKNPKDVQYGSSESLTAPPGDSAPAASGGSSKGGIWLWIAIGIAGYFVWRYMRKK